MLRFATSLPDALVGVAPNTGGASCLRLDDRPQLARQALVAAGVKQYGVEDSAEDVILVLAKGGIADANRARTCVPRQIISCRFEQIASAINAVHDLQRAVLGRLDVRDDCMNSSASHSRFSQWSAWSMNVVSRIQV